MISILISLLFLSPQTSSKPEYFIIFSKIDNQVKVYVQDSLVFQSELVDGNPKMELKVNLNNYLKKGINDVRVELYNGSGEGFIESDTHWEIYYEIFKDDDPIDYMSEKSENGKEGLVFSMTHEIVVY